MTRSIARTSMMVAGLVAAVLGLACGPTTRPAPSATAAGPTAVDRKAALEAAFALAADAVKRREPSACAKVEFVAANGHPKAQYLLALMLAEGSLCAKDAARQRLWLERAARNPDGDPADEGRRAAYGAGTMAYAGAGGARDVPAALRWFELAAERGHPEAFGALAEHHDAMGNRAAALRWAKAGAAIGDYTSSIMLVVLTGDTSGLEALAAREGARDPPIVRAASAGDLAAVQRHILAGCDVDALTPVGSALMIAAEMGNAEIAAALLAAGADPDLQDDLGDSALLRAAYSGHRHVVLLLLDRGARVDHATLRGTTPLISAAWQGHADVVELLLARGADPDVVTQDGLTALGLATATRRTQVIELLRRAGATR